jgi:mono/diheme cytochrome c family protein
MFSRATVMLRVRGLAHGLRGLSWVAFVVSALAGPAHAAGPAEAKKIFTQRCMACHTFGKGIKVGPDLKGVTQRRPIGWLLKFVRSSQTVIQGGDPVARQLFRDFKQQLMPDWTDLSEDQIGAILDWLGKSGPEQKAADERHAETASAAEIERGRALFAGTRPLSAGGLACATCHRLGHERDLRGGALGPDLTGAYFKHQDAALTLYLRRPCFPRRPEAARPEYLTAEDSFALKALLRHEALSPESRASASTSAGAGGPKRGGP